MLVQSSILTMIPWCLHACKYFPVQRISKGHACLPMQRTDDSTRQPPMTWCCPRIRRLRTISHSKKKGIAAGRFSGLTLKPGGPHGSIIKLLWPTGPAQKIAACKKKYTMHNLYGWMVVIRKYLYTDPPGSFWTLQTFDQQIRSSRPPYRSARPSAYLYHHAPAELCRMNTTFLV